MIVQHYSNSFTGDTLQWPPSSSNLKMDVVTSSLLLVFSVFVNCPVMTSTPYIRCPLTCACDGTLVTCRHSYLTDIPKFPRETQTIYIKLNNISRLRADAFSELTNLTILHIANNNIRSIDERAFKGLASLDSLVLKEDSLNAFQNGSFRFLSSLRNLRMRTKLIQPPQADICLLKHLRQLRLEMFKFSSAMFHSCFEGLVQLHSLVLLNMQNSNMSRATFHPFRDSLKLLSLHGCGLHRLAADMFKDLSQLVSLDLTDNDITALPRDIFARHTNLVQLVLAGNKLKVISSELLSPLRLLKILNTANNPHLTMTLGAEFDNMTQLQQLILAGTNLTSLDNDTFRHMRNSALKQLNLRQCHLHFINRGTFRPLVKITELVLSDNKLNSSALHEALFGLQGAPLRELVMSNLNLGELSATLFEGLGDTNITVVWLQSSHIASIKKGAFRNLQKLTSLHLDANQLALLEDHVFEDLSNLVYLNLENNHIVDLPSAKRVGLSPGLSVLVLDMNSIKHITYDSLKGYTNLTNLYLRHNNIYKITDDAFKPLSRLKTLDLRENRIKWLSPGIFDTLTRLEILLLAKNDITLETSSLFQVCTTSFITLTIRVYQIQHRTVRCLRLVDENYPV